jgi:hypothetical protein
MLDHIQPDLFSMVAYHPLLAQGGEGDGGRGMVVLVLIIGALVVLLAFIAIFARYFRLWIQSVTTGAGIGILDLLRMTFRKVNPTVITRSKIMAVQAGIYDSEGVTTKGLGRITWPAAMCRW